METGMDNIEIKQKLTLEELGILEAEMLKKMKGREIAWGLWFGLSFFGAHRFYTENYNYASAMLLTSAIPLIGIIYMIFQESYSEFWLYFFIFLLAGSVVWSWIDAIFLNRRIDEINNKIEWEILRSIKKN